MGQATKKFKSTLNIERKHYSTKTDSTIKDQVKMLKKVGNKLTPDGGYKFKDAVASFIYVDQDSGKAATMQIVTGFDKCPEQLLEQVAWELQLLLLHKAGRKPPRTRNRDDRLDTSISDPDIKANN